ncbi:MAG: ABC transporter permease [Hyphomicrobiaceae bacterium]|nr:ABC transporter permease [Hyphomicrobiaceae bacterium]
MLSRPATETQITHGRRLWLYVVVALALVFLVVPSLLVIPLSFSSARYLSFPPPGWSMRWYEAYLGSREWREATVASFVAAGSTTVIATAFGTLAAYSLATARGGLARLIYAAYMLPLIIPAILIAIGTFLLYAQIGLNSTLLGVVLAHTVMALPLVVITVAAGLKSYDMNQELAARSLGASRPIAFLTVTLPQIRIAVASGALLAFITSLDEVVISLFVAGGNWMTLTKRMFNALRDEIDPTIAAISSLLIAVSILLLGASQLLQARQRTSR